ncbi:MAG: hypothetical protein ABSD88_04620 [Candidatus Korobacteraceae bacterium]
MPEQNNILPPILMVLGAFFVMVLLTNAVDSYGASAFIWTAFIVFAIAALTSMFGDHHNTEAHRYDRAVLEAARKQLAAQKGVVPTPGQPRGRILELSALARSIADVYLQQGEATGQSAYERVAAGMCAHERTALLTLIQRLVSYKKKLKFGNG